MGLPIAGCGNAVGARKGSSFRGVGQQAQINCSTSRGQPLLHKQRPACQTELVPSKVGNCWRWWSSRWRACLGLLCFVKTDKLARDSGHVVMEAGRAALLAYICNWRSELDTKGSCV